MSETMIKRRGERVKISGEMTIYHSAQLKNELNNHFVRCNKLDLDLSEVSEFDSAGFQVLALFYREAMAQGKNFQLAKCSQPVRAALKVFQVDWLDDHTGAGVAATMK